MQPLQAPTASSPMPHAGQNVLVTALSRSRQSSNVLALRKYSADTAEF